MNCCSEGHDREKLLLGLNGHLLLFSRVIRIPCPQRLGRPWEVLLSEKPRTHRKMRKLDTPNMMKVIPVPRATMASVERGAEGQKETLRKTGGGD